MPLLKKFKQFVNEITAEDNQDYKIAVLEKYKDDEDIKYLLNFIYNLSITTGISDEKLTKVIDNKLPRFLAFSLKEVLEYLQYYNAGTDACIATVQDYSDHAVDEEDELLYNKLVTKNIQLGIDLKTINKIIPDLNKYSDPGLTSITIEG